MKHILIIACTALTVVACATPMHRVNTITLTEMSRNGETRKLNLEDIEPTAFIYDKNNRIQQWKGSCFPVNFKYVYNDAEIMLIDSSYGGEDKSNIITDGDNNAISVGKDRVYTYSNNRLKYIRAGSCGLSIRNIEWVEDNVVRIYTSDFYDSSMEEKPDGFEIVEIIYSKHKNRQNFNMTYGMLWDKCSSLNENDHGSYINSALIIAELLGKQPEYLISKITTKTKSGETIIVTTDYNLNRDGTINTEKISINDGSKLNSLTMSYTYR